jgi:hypothetical protein
MKNLARFKKGVLAGSLLIAVMVCAPFADAAPKEPSDTTSRSDLNSDGIVNYADLVIFSTSYLEQDVDSVAWCTFYDATLLKGMLYGRKSDFYVKHFSELLRFISYEFDCDLSDLNRDTMVAADDLFIFSYNFLGLNSETVDWCAFYEATTSEERFLGKMTHFYLKRFKLLLGFLADEFGCVSTPNLLAVKNRPKSLARIAHDIDYTGNYYISDARVGSVFIYDTSRRLFGELKNLDKPLGVAIDSQGYLLVGNSGRHNIEVYDPANGDLLATFGEGLVQMPTAITIGPNDDIYVTDSKAHKVWVFESSYVHVRTIGMPGKGEGQLKFPTDTEIITREEDGTFIQEVYIADQRNHRIQVFSLDGTYSRAIGPSLALSSYCINYGWYCPKNIQGTFNRLKALDTDADGRLHVLDMFEAKVIIIDPVSGALIGSYGAWGEGIGLLRVPLDILTTDWGEAFVTDNGSGELEIFTIP